MTSYLTEKSREAAPSGATAIEHATGGRPDESSDHPRSWPEPYARYG